MLGAAVGFLLSAGPAFAGPSVTLAWDASLSANAVGYRLYSQEQGVLLATRTDVGSQTQTTVTGLKDGLRYYFTVTAYNSLGLESLLSAVLTFDAPVTLRILPASPTNRWVRIQFPVAPGHWYELQASTDLQSWTTLWQTSAALLYSWVEFEDLQSDSLTHRFYRLQIH